ncbi:MAG TPA: fused MFS/spermidine synthase, partial [Micromonospora sp.]
MVGQMPGSAGADRIELVVDGDRPSGRTLLADGVEQSYVDLHDPTYLHFEYVRRLASLVDCVARRGAPLRVLHLGGGALTLPRYVAATRPGSTQVVVERDATLAALVRRELPAGAGDLRMVLGDAAQAVADEPAGRYDLVLTDVYQGARMPASVSGIEFVERVARVLRPDGYYGVNLTDLPPLVFSRVQVATVRAVFADVCLVADRRMLRGRRYGNLVLAAARGPGPLPVSRLATAAVRDRCPGTVLH